MSGVTLNLALPERYTPLRHIANGGMAGVWAAHDSVLGRDVAIKLLAEQFLTDVAAKARFEREARAAASLSSHPNVVTIYDVAEHEGRPMIVMELFSDGTVADALRRGPVPREQALDWLAQAAEGLDAAHAEGVVHRDIKPANLLIDGQRLGVADFGIARVAWETSVTQTGEVLGTAAYISPEQAEGRPGSAASDRYAFAVVAYELLTGSRPFDGGNFAAQARAHIEDAPLPASAREPVLPRAVDAVLDRGLAKLESERWPTAASMVAALRSALGEGAPSAQRKRLPGWIVAAPIVVALAISAVIALAAGDDGSQTSGQPADRRAAAPQKQPADKKPDAAPSTPAAQTPAPEPEPAAPPAPSAWPPSSTSRALRCSSRAAPPRRSRSFSRPSRTARCRGPTRARSRCSTWARRSSPPDARARPCRSSSSGCRTRTSAGPSSARWRTRRHRPARTADRRGRPSRARAAETVATAATGATRRSTGLCGGRLPLMTGSLGARGRWAGLGVLVGAMLVLAAPAPAHVERRSGPFRVTLGWGAEPAIAGDSNFVDVAVADRAGAAVTVAPGALSVDVATGGEQITLPLVGSELPGQLRATIVPTRPGTYSFHVRGTVLGRGLDVTATCSDRSFDCVTPASEVQFPDRQPSNAELAQRLAREIPRARRAAEEEADDARTLAIVALALAAASLATGLGLARRSRRKPS